MSKELIKSAPFDMAARLPLQLGRESIASSTAAVAELIKNCYDANAENVKIKFVKLSSPVSLLIIEDDGDGMDLTTLESAWLRIGTEHKSDRIMSPRKNRIFTGAKGLGRLGIDRLCNKLILQTKILNEKDILELQVDWKKYNNKNATISSITHKILKTSHPAKIKYGNLFERSPKGTRLILVGLKDDWSEIRLTTLRNELSLLVSPFASVNDFAIDFECLPQFKSEILSSEKSLDLAVWAVTAKISEEQEIEIDYLHVPSGEKIKEGPSKWEKWLPERINPECGPLEMKLYYIPQPDEPGPKKRDWSSFMEQNNGIRIYRDNFRVRPYGEPTGRGDWLDIGIRKAKNPSGIRQGNWHIAPHQVLGAVFISRIMNNQLIDQANREGMVETKAFHDLRGFALKVILNFENIAIKHAQKNSPPEEDQSRLKNELDKSLEQSNKAVLDLKEAISSNSEINKKEIEKHIELIGKYVEDTQKASEKHERAYAAKREEMEREKDTLANLASLGILTVCFGHEAKEFCNLAAVSALELKEGIELGKFMVHQDIEDQIFEDIQTIIDSTTFIRNFAAFSLGNVKKEKRRRRKVSIYEVAQRVFTSLKDSLKRQNIEIDISGIPSDIPSFSAFEIDWESILVNLISNSIWALRDTPKGHRAINLTAESTDGFIIIRFSDSGCGIESGTENHLFNPMYSTRRDDKGNVVGTGMGLSIVKTFVEDHAKGSIQAIKNCVLGGAEFIIRVPENSN